MGDLGWWVRHGTDISYGDEFLVRKQKRECEKNLSISEPRLKLESEKCSHLGLAWYVIT
jgi:hypothetical protein